MRRSRLAPAHGSPASEVTLVCRGTVAAGLLAVVFSFADRDPAGGRPAAGPVVVGWLAGPQSGLITIGFSVQSLRTCNSKKLPLGPWNSVLRLGYGGASWA